MGLDIIELGRDPFVLAVPSRLAGFDHPASLSNCAQSPWVSARPDAGFQAVAELAARRVGFRPDIVARADNYRLVLDLVAAGLGVALVPSSAERATPSVQICELDASLNFARLEALVKRSAGRSAATIDMYESLIDRFNSVIKQSHA